MDTVTDHFRERIYRRNFPLFLVDYVMFSVALGMISATTVIPDFVRRLTDSEILIGLTSSLGTVGFTLPQLFIARHIVRHARKKWWFVGPNIPVRFAILIFAIITALLGHEHPTLILAAFLVSYAIATFGDGLVGVPWTDMTASSLDNRWRARLFGVGEATTGVIMLLLTPLIGLVLSEAAFPHNYALLFGAAGLVFALSILPGLFFHELPSGQAQPHLPTRREFMNSLGELVRHDGPFRAFITVRICTSLFMMAAPFYIGYGTVRLGLSSAVAVPVLLGMFTVGRVTGALGYTWLGARNNLLAIQLALGGAVLVPVCALVAGVVGPWPLYVGFLLSGLTTENLHVGYLNWLVGYAHPDQRPIYVGLSNTIAAVFSLMAPLIGGAIAEYWGYRPLFAVALVIAALALVVTLRHLDSPP